MSDEEVGLCHPGPLRRWELFNSVSAARARRLWYAGSGDPYWRILDIPNSVLRFEFSEEMIDAMAGHPPEGPPGAAADAFWVPWVPPVPGVPAAPGVAAVPAVPFMPQQIPPGLFHYSVGW
jgi:hypothetical protein